MLTLPILNLQILIFFRKSFFFFFFLFAGSFWLISKLTWKYQFKSLCYIMFMTSNHQTANLFFANYLHKFFSVWAVETVIKLFIGPKPRRKKNLFWTNKKFLFQLLKVRKIHGKIWENKIGCLVVWCHEQGTYYRIKKWVPTNPLLEKMQSYKIKLKISGKNEQIQNSGLVVRIWTKSNGRFCHIFVSFLEYINFLLSNQVYFSFEC